MARYTFQLVDKTGFQRLGDLKNPPNKSRKQVENGLDPVGVVSSGRGG